MYVLRGVGRTKLLFKLSRNFNLRVVNKWPLLYMGNCTQHCRTYRSLHVCQALLYRTAIQSPSCYASLAIISSTGLHNDLCCDKGSNDHARNWKEASSDVQSTDQKKWIPHDMLYCQGSHVCTGMWWKSHGKRDTVVSNISVAAPSYTCRASKFFVNIFLMQN